MIDPLIPNKPRGVPRIDGRRVLNGIFWVFRSGAPWRDLPERYERVQTDGGDYSMNHNASVFLFDATGRFATMIDYHDPRDFAVPKIRRAMNDS